MKFVASVRAVPDRGGLTAAERLLLPYNTLALPITNYIIKRVRTKETSYTASTQPEGF